MKKNATPRRNATKRSTACKGVIQKKSAATRPTYFSLLKHVEYALKHEHMNGASLQKLKRHLERKHGGKPFDAAAMKMLRSAVKRLHKKGRIKKHPSRNVYKFKQPIVPAHHIFGTAKQRREGRAQARAQARARPSRRSSGAKRSRPNRSSKPARRRRY